MKAIPGGQYRPLTEEGIRRIHESALTLLSEIGVEVHSRLAFETFRQKGADCDPAKKLVKLSRTGWDEDISAARSWGDLPVNAVNYLRRIEKITGVPVGIVSVGPDRVQTF